MQADKIIKNICKSPFGAKTNCNVNRNACSSDHAVIPFSTLQTQIGEDTKRRGWDHWNVDSSQKVWEIRWQAGQTQMRGQ
jgi:hypothetical protein